MYQIYLLKHNIHNISYVGITVDIKRRLKQHNKIIKGGAKFTTRHSANWILDRCSYIINKSQALKIEHLIKKELGLYNRQILFDKIFST